MANIKRVASAYWEGGLQDGKGRISNTSGVLKETPYNFRMRFENEAGTNPEELLAAAHAACFSMALSAAFGDQEIVPERIDTQATCVMEPLAEGGFKIARMLLDVRVSVPGVNQEQFDAIIKEADQGCPVSNLLRNGLAIELKASLV